MALPTPVVPAPHLFKRCVLVVQTNELVIISTKNSHHGAHTHTHTATSVPTNHNEANTFASSLPVGTACEKYRNSCESTWVSTSASAANGKAIKKHYFMVFFLLLNSEWGVLPQVAEGRFHATLFYDPCLRRAPRAHQVPTWLVHMNHAQ